MRLSLIVAVARNRVIGRRGQLPWRLSSDLKRFKSLTMGHHLIMGRKTYESLGRPLPGRVLLVLSRSAADEQSGAATMPPPDVPGPVVFVSGLPRALQLAANDREAFIIGGADVFAAALPLVERLYVTWVEGDPEGDVLLPALNLKDWQLVEETPLPADAKNEFPTRFCVYDRR